MDKKIEDYLHLYLGCDVRHNNGSIVKMNSIALNNMLNNKYEMQEYKPILRPLSDMTEEEKIEVRKFDKVELPHFELTRYLLSKHFDLFGLIEAGLAIEKTKVNY